MSCSRQPRAHGWGSTLDPQAQQRLTRAATREGRVQLVGEAAQALLAGRLPSREAALFVGGALLAYLEQGGALERDFLQVTKAKSHQTPARIWRELGLIQMRAANPDSAQASSRPHRYDEKE